MVPARSISRWPLRRVFSVNIQRSLVYIGIIEAQGKKPIKDFLGEILVGRLSVSLTFDQCENGTSKIALHMHMGEEIGFSTGRERAEHANWDQ